MEARLQKVMENRGPTMTGASWMVMETMGMSWDMHMFDKWSMHAPCTDHGRYKSPAAHVDLLGHPPSNK